MTRLIIMIVEVCWQPKNWINLLTFKIKNNCLARNWPKVNLNLEQKDTYFKFIFVFVFEIS